MDLINRDRSKGIVVFLFFQRFFKNC